MSIRIFVVVIALTLIGGCATSYHAYSDFKFIGASDGYWDAKGPGKLFKVGFVGNNYLEKDKLTEYLLYRCAEIAKQEGGSYFLAYDTLPLAVAGKLIKTTSSTTVKFNPSGFLYILPISDNEENALSVERLLDVPVK